MRLDLSSLAHEPFCAGAIVLEGARLVLTLNRDGLPADVAEPALRVGGVGGGQEPGETVWDCAVREAGEEIGVTLQIVSAPATWLLDPNEAEPRQIEVGDGPAPLLVERADRPNPDVPFAEGLPTGPFTYFVTFLAAAVEEAVPGDVEGVLLLPPGQFPALDGTPTLAEAERAGAELRAREPLAPETRLWLHPYESLRVALPLAAGAGIALR